MTLRLAIAQIQRPSWWGMKDISRTAPPKGTHIHAAGIKRAAVLKAIRTAGQRVDCAWLVANTGHTTQSIRHSTNRLVEDGDIRRIETQDGRVFWEPR
jgi:hypothetical protein